ncbi:phospholipase A1 2-like isoform X1 [Rhynchophorus ferrugineus]|uniref:phospholipase A1 2-like isoform X1 n=1 Tax=Rhynchophorus ferrugineus TaxID=354439 RepID=UPI003FCE872A
MVLCIKIVGYFVFLVVFQAAGASITDELKNKAFSLYKNLAIGARRLKHNPGISEDQISFELYQKEYPEDLIHIDIDDLEIFRGTKSKIVFLVHGYVSNSKTKQVGELKDTFLRLDDVSYVINVDWEKAADQLYYISALNTYDVADIIAKFIINLYRNYEVDKNNILLVGHSLGGQICGFVGKIFKQNTLELLPRIIALDPAGPLFSIRPAHERLNPNDAAIVEVIHTDGGVLGLSDSCGTIDFFVNGGKNQPGCKQIDLDDIFETATTPLICDHIRAWDYFLEALLNPNGFIASKCLGTIYDRENCNGETVSMGDINLTAEGNYYLETNRHKPFAKNLSD